VLLGKPPSSAEAIRWAHYRKPLRNKRERFLSIPNCFLPQWARQELLRSVQGLQNLFSSDPADAVFYIQQGRVKLKVKSKQGKEAVIAILGAGDFLGEGCLIGQTVCLVTATTIAPGFILRIEKNEILRVFHEEHTFSDFFLPYVLSRNAAHPRGFGRSTF